jgi:hypothetical protein
MRSRAAWIYSLFKTSIFMGKQTSVFTVEGKVGQASFYKGKKGYLVRQKGGVSAARIASDPKFENTRKAGQEFGRAGEANRLFRTAFAPLLKNGSDGSVSRRLSKVFMTVVHADAVNPFGDRIVLHPNIPELEGFDCNANALMSANMVAPVIATIDRVAGHMSIAIAPFVPKTVITPPDAATHYKIVTGSAEIDFINSVIVTSTQQETNPLPLDNNPTAAINLQTNVTPNSALPLFLLVGIQYFIMVNNGLNPIGGGKSNALQIVKVTA